MRRGEGEPLPDIVWLDADATPMVDDDWESGLRAIGMFLNGNGIRGRDRRGEDIYDTHFLLYFNAHDEPVSFTLPSDEYADAWETVIDTAGVGADSTALRASSVVDVAAKALVVLRAYTEPEVEPDHSVAASLAVLTHAQADRPAADPRSDIS